MLNVVERVINEEAELGNDAELIVHTPSQLIADTLLIGLNVFQQLVGPFGWEDAQMSRADTQVGRHACGGDADEHTVHLLCLTLEDIGQLLLEQACYTVLSCLLHVFVMGFYE